MIHRVSRFFGYHSGAYLICNVVVDVVKYSLQSLGMVQIIASFRTVTLVYHNEKLSLILNCYVIYTLKIICFYYFLF